MWPLSASSMGRCERLRRTMANAVSMMGTPAARMGTRSDTNRADLATAKSETIPSEKPRSKAPESPMKIEAGWKL